MPASYRHKHTTNFVGINRAKHKNLALNPSRRTLMLYYAIEKVGLTYEREAEFDAGDYPIWFNAKVQLADGKTGVIFLYDYCTKTYRYNYRVRQRKLEYIRNHPELFVLECWPGGSDDIAAQISLWLATIKIRPQRVCEGRRPRQFIKTLKRYSMHIEHTS